MTKINFNHILLQMDGEPYKKQAKPSQAHIDEERAAASSGKPTEEVQMMMEHIAIKHNVLEPITLRYVAVESLGFVHAEQDKNMDYNGRRDLYKLAKRIDRDKHYEIYSDSDIDTIKRRINMRFPGMLGAAIDAMEIAPPEEEGAAPGKKTANKK